MGVGFKVGVDHDILVVGLVGWLVGWLGFGCVEVGIGGDGPAWVLCVLTGLMRLVGICDYGVCLLHFWGYRLCCFDCFREYCSRQNIA